MENEVHVQDQGSLYDCFFFKGWLGNKVREFYHDNKWVICAGEFTRINVTAYVTGLTILMMAADR